jgi:hypothetical protein
MTTKKNKAIKKKYSKNTTRKNIKFDNYENESYKSIEEIYDKTKADKDNERALSCFLANNNKIVDFSINLFYFMINHWKVTYPKIWKNIIKKNIVERKDDKLIRVIGFSKSDCNKIIGFVEKNDKINFYSLLKNKFLKVTSSINNLVEPKFTFYYVDKNIHLQKIFIKELEKLLAVNDIDWNTFKEFYNSLTLSKEKDMFNFFIFDVIYESNKNVTSIYRSNLGNMNFFRNRLYEFKHNKSDFKRFDECSKSAVGDEYKDYGIYNSKEHYKIESKSPYAKIMNKFNKTFLGGPSGSTALAFIMIFNFYKFPFTHENKMLLFGMLIADYIPLWHTITEIIMMAYPEFQDNSIPKFYLSEDPTLYAIKLLKPVLK